MIFFTQAGRLCPRRMSSADEEPQSRQWQWIFRALWSAAPKSGEAAHTHSLRRARCHLHLLVPDTILFQRGEPCKWLGSSPEGIVVRKTFCGANGSGDGSFSADTFSAAEAPPVHGPEALATRVAAKRQAPPPSRGMDEFEIVERLDTVIAAFVSFAAAGSSSSSSSSSGSEVGVDAPVCVARYNDGTTEVLSIKSLQTLCRFYNWRTSLCALQAYVRPAQGITATIIGTFDRKHARHGKARRLLHPQSPTSARGADSLAQSYASHWNSSRALAGEDEPSTLNSASSTTVATSTTEPTAVAGDVSSSSQLLPVSTAALDQAAKDVAFVTDMSYAWPAESPRTMPRLGHGIATGTNNIRPRDPEGIGGNVKHDERTQAGARPVVLVGGPVGQPKRPAPPWPKSRVRVSRLDAEFVIDQHGRAWLTNAPKV